MTINEATAMRKHAATVLKHQQAQAATADAAETPAEAAPPLDPSFAAPTLVVVKREVSTPSLNIPPGATAILRITTPIEESNLPDAKYGPARICHVEAMNGQVRVWVLNEVVYSSLTKAYPKGEYVGGWFRVTCLPGLKEGKRGAYRDYAVTEIEPPLNAA